MTSRNALLSLLVLSALSSAAFAQDSASPPPPVMIDGSGVGDTTLDNKNDVGTPDPLNALEGQPAEAPPAPPVSPEFKDVNNAPETPAPEAAPIRPTTPARKARRAEAAPVERNPDGPNFGREQRFHSIYKKYNEQPTPLEAWEQASAARRSESYKVQKGDTLWALSSTLFGDAGYWPKVWALNNDQVYNPHEIDTWMQIRFFPGDLNEPPTLAVADAPKPAPGAETATDADAALIPPAKKTTPIVKQLPSSIPLYRYAGVSRPSLNIEGLRAAPPAAKARASLTYQVSETPIQGVGTVKETELGVQSASEYQYVFVQVDDDSQRVLLVVKDVGTLRSSDRSGAATAHLIEVQGEVELIEKVNEQSNVYRAIVRKNLSAVEVGSRVTRGRIETVATDDGKATPGPQVQLIGAQFSDNRRLADFDGFVFMNGGAAAGLAEGAILPIHANMRVRNPATTAVTNDRQVANVRIVKVTDNFATGFITKMWDDVAIGDSVGGGSGTAAAIEAIPSASAPADLDDDLPPTPTKAGLEDELDGSGDPASRDSEVLPGDELSPEDDDLAL